jgi:Tfp pilus assembly protein PilE
MKQGHILKKAGVSLLELVLVIAIIGTMILTSIRFFNIATENAKVNNAVSMTRDIADASFKWYESNTSFTKPEFNFTTLVQMNLLPTKYADSALTATMNPWGGSVKLAASGSEHFKITLTELPHTSCEKLKSQLGDFKPNCKTIEKDGDTFVAEF